MLVPVLVTLVCLAVIGASVTYVVLARSTVRAAYQSREAVPGAPAGGAGTPTPAATTPGPAAATPAQPSARPSVTRSSAPGGPARCRPEAQADAEAAGGDVGDLVQRLKIRTAAGTVAYICATDGGELYYHGSRSGEQAQWRNGVNALFVAGVRQAGDGYVATVPEADGTVTTITVTARQWRKENPKQKAVVEAAVGG